MANSVKPKVSFEKVSESSETGAKTWKIEAIHVTVTGNKRKYTREELTLGARSLSYRPINVNHDEGRWLDYNFQNPTASNTTLEMEFDASKNAVVGSLLIYDSAINSVIEAGGINKLSIEQVPTKGESCSCSITDCTCEQHGITFTGIALLEKGVQPGDPETKISKEAIKKKKEAEDEEPCKDGYHKDDEGKCVPDEDKAEAEDDEECPEGSHKDDDGKCVKDEEPKEECGCALSKALGKELYAELKRAEHFAKTGELK